jgi:hypothetical protein
MPFDLDQFTERASICEFDGGMTRFAAETLAAKEQGMARWQALKEITDADGQRLAGGHGHQAHALAGERDAHDLPELQRASQEEARPMPECDAQAGRDRGALLSLRMDSRTEVQR